VDEFIREARAKIFGGGSAGTHVTGTGAGTKYRAPRPTGEANLFPNSQEMVDEFLTSWSAKLVGSGGGGVSAPGAMTPRFNRTAATRRFSMPAAPHPNPKRVKASRSEQRVVAIKRTEICEAMSKPAAPTCAPKPPETNYAVPKAKYRAPRPTGEKNPFPDSETVVREWFEDLQARIEHWFPPLAAGGAFLQSCMGAFGLHMASRLDRSYKLWKALGGAYSDWSNEVLAPPPPPRQDEAACDLLQTELGADGALGLPEFPPFPDTEAFELPHVLPIPRLLPREEWMQSYREGREGELWAEGGTPSQMSQSVLLGRFAIGIVGVAGSAALVIGALLLQRRRKRTRLAGPKEPSGWGWKPGGGRLSMRRSCVQRCG
jgi:hypothetical protein